jgi:hypothetical protein
LFRYAAPSFGKVYEDSMSRDSGNSSGGTPELHRRGIVRSVILKYMYLARIYMYIRQPYLLLSPSSENDIFPR